MFYIKPQLKATYFFTDKPSRQTDEEQQSQILHLNFQKESAVLMEKKPRNLYS